MPATKFKCKILAIDLSSLIFRSFYGLPTSIKDSEGFAINGVKGYLETLIRLKKIYSPEIIVHAIDEDWRPKWRTDLLPQYKAHRVIVDNEEEVDDDLERQIELLPTILKELGMQCIGKANYEADDVLSTISKQNINTVVVSGDKDLFQIVNNKRKIFVHLLGKDGGKTYDEIEIKERFGIEANSYLDFAVLKGDSSDGLPGVKGIGEKTAVSIINNFKTIENLINNYQNSKVLSTKQKQSIAESIPYLKKALKVVKLKDDLKIMINKPKYKDTENVKKRLKKYRIENQINSLLSN
ncbi:MAG: hypothetical protein RLZZ37_179 [Actinomycetota bacterium]|jgi:5'-3' exonuclease